MSGLMDKAKDMMGKKEQGAGQPGNNVERRADDTVNTQVDNAAHQAGVPGKADNTINKFVDDKVNSQIPGGK